MRITVTLPSDSEEAVRSAAREKGLTPSEWARSVLVTSAAATERARQKREKEGT